MENRSQNTAANVKVRPETLVFTTGSGEDTIGLKNKENDTVHSTGTFSPALSDLSTSSVNIRQRKLSETVIDWVFDESDTGFSTNTSMSDISEGTSSPTYASKFINV